MRVLQINSARTFGGGEKHLVDLCFCLQTREHEVYVALRPAADWREKLSFVTPEKLFTLPLKNALDLRSAFLLAQIIKQHKIEIVHAHLARDYTLAALAVRLSRTNARLVLTRHVLFPLNRSHKFVLPRSTTLIAVSKAVRDSLLTQKIAAADCIKLVYNGVDTRSFAAAKRNFNRTVFLEKLKLAPTRRYVGIVGEISVGKGQADFIRAAALVAADDRDVDFLIVGRDNSLDERHAAELKSLVSKLNLGSRVHFIGWRSDIESVLGAMDVFVSASHYESFGLAIVEAMAIGLPIAATMTAGAREILTDGETGKLIPIANAEAMAKAIKYFLNSEEARQSFSKKAQAIARERFDLARMMIEVEKIYQTSA